MRENSLMIAKLLLSNTEVAYTPLKLQKILYYCQAFHLAILDKTLFIDDIEAWQWGPVIPVVYEEYKHHASNIIDPVELIDYSLAGDSTSVISNVLEVYGDKGGSALMRLTHSESPWQNAWEQGKGTIISQEAMQSFYKTLLN